MPSQKKTAHLGLSQHSGAEHFKRADYVDDMKAIDDAVGLKPNRYSNSDMFSIGSSKIVVHAACKENTIVHIYPQEVTPEDKKGLWSVVAEEGKFRVLSDTVETKNIPFVWEFFGGGE